MERRLGAIKQEESGFIPAAPVFMTGSAESPVKIRPNGSIPMVENSSIERNRSIASIRQVRRTSAPSDRRRRSKKSSVAGKLVQSIESTWRRRKSSLLNRKILDIEDESSRTARLAKEHDAMVKDYGIRSLRRASFFLDQENGLSIQTIMLKRTRSRSIRNSKRCQVTNKLPIIRFRNRLRWDTLIILFVLYSSFQIPYDTTFRTQSQPLFLAVIESLIDVAFAIDLCTNFCTTYMDEHQHIEINNSKKMAIHYLQGFFWIDLLATVPFELIFGSVVTSLGWLGALKMVRLLRLGRLVKKLDDVTAAGLFRLFRIILGIMLFLHWLACLLYWVIRTEDRTLTSTIWGDHIIVVDGSSTDFDLYFSFLYTTITMMFRSIDVHPHTTLERAFVGVVTIFGSMMQSILFGSVVVLISSFDASQVDYNRHSVEIVQRLKQLRVPGPIIKRSKQFMDLLWTNQHSKDVGVNDFLSSLSPVLATEIKLSLYLKKIKATPFFETCGREVLIALSNCVNTKVYMAGDRIIRRGEYGSWMAFIAKGSVSVLVPRGGGDGNDGNDDGSGIENRTEKEVAVLSEGDGGYFGEMALLYDKPRNATIEARSWLRIHQLYREDFHRVFNLYPAEKIKMNAEINRMKVFKTDRKSHQHSNGNFLYNENEGETSESGSKIKKTSSDQPDGKRLESISGDLGDTICDKGSGEYTSQY